LPAAAAFALDRSCEVDMVDQARRDELLSITMRQNEVLKLAIWQFGGPQGLVSVMLAWGSGPQPGLP